MVRLVSKDGVVIDEDDNKGGLETQEASEEDKNLTALEVINSIIRQGSSLGEVPKDHISGFTLIAETDAGPLIIGTGYSVQDYLNHLEQTVFKLRATILNNEGN